MTNLLEFRASAGSACGPDRAGETRGHLLRVALVASPLIAVPPYRYGGTERVISTLAEALVDRGHDVTVYASGDSRVSCRLVATRPRALWRDGSHADPSAAIAATADRVLADESSFDVIHSHLEGESFRLARHASVPVVATLHGRLDVGSMPQQLAENRRAQLVAISESQRRWSPAANWIATIHHGLDFQGAPFRTGAGGYLAVVGRSTPEKGIAEAIETAAATSMPLRIAAKVHDPQEVAYFDAVIRPAVRDRRVEFLGELDQPGRDDLLAGALATLMLGSWPEPFGLVAIESLATGTPVIARRAGALPEIVRHGVNGFLVDDVLEAAFAVRQVERLDRAAIRADAVRRFSAERMASEYEAVYRAAVRRADQQGTPFATTTGSRT